ncbi:MAG: hypothetical protein EOO45_23150 [Flavobacterium sp.]|nr:MAG: hypothetical protein EOO45_23150 [Flavobacterium sp.]
MLFSQAFSVMLISSALIAQNVRQFSQPIQEASSKRAAQITDPTRALCSIRRLILELRTNPSRSKEIIGFDNENARIAGCNWDDALDGIEYGEIELYQLLAPYSDASYSESLSIALDRMIYFAPEKALRMGKCIPDAIEPSYPDWIEFLEAGYSRVALVKDAGLKKARSACLFAFTSLIAKGKEDYRRGCIKKLPTSFGALECSKSNDFEKYINGNKRKFAD